MMRPPRAAVIAALSLLASTATASAECAWVLWQETHTDPIAPGRAQDPVVLIRGESRWEIHGTHATKDQCLTSAESKWPDVRRQRGPVGRDGKVVALTMTDLKCLPDTVDPRGPKAK